MVRCYCKTDSVSSLCWTEPETWQSRRYGEIMHNTRQQRNVCFWFEGNWINIGKPKKKGDMKIFSWKITNLQIKLIVNSYDLKFKITTLNSEVWNFIRKDCILWTHLMYSCKLFRNLWFQYRSNTCQDTLLCVDTTLSGFTGWTRVTLAGFIRDAT